MADLLRVSGRDVTGGAVTYTKTTLVVRSVIVGSANVLSNVLHLGSHGIGPTSAAKGMRAKNIELSQNGLVAVSSRFF